MGNSAWKSKADYKEMLAYISNETQARADLGEYYNSASKGLLEVATKIMEDMKEKGLLTKSVTKEGKEYTDKAVINVAPLEVYNKETQEKEIQYSKDGTLINQLSITIPYNSEKEKLVLYAKNDISNGIVLQNMIVSKYEKDADAEKGTFKYFKENEIKNAPISDNIKAIAGNIQDMGIIVHKEIVHSHLRTFAYEMNQKFNEFSDKVMNSDNKLVNDAYAKYVNNEHGEKVELRNHQDNIVVVVGFNKENVPYVNAYNFDFIMDNGRPAYAPIKTEEDCEMYEIHSAIRPAINEFKEMAKNLSKETVATKKSENSSADEMELD